VVASSIQTVPSADNAYRRRPSRVNEMLLITRSLRNRPRSEKSLVSTSATPWSEVNYGFRPSWESVELEADSIVPAGAGRPVTAAVRPIFSVVAAITDTRP